MEKIKSNVDKIKKSYADNPNITFGEMIEIVREGGVFEIPRKYNEDSEKYAEFFATKFSQIIPYSSYVNDQSGFRTHHGVKGLQFDCVMAIIDNDSKWFAYNHSKFFLGGGVNEGTLKLLYVICTRAKKGLAIVLYADATKEQIGKEWFSDDEIIVLN